MVYAVRSNRAIVSGKPLKKKRAQSVRSKENEEFLNSHYVLVQTDPSGKVIVKAIEKDHD